MTQVLTRRAPRMLLLSLTIAVASTSAWAESARPYEKTVPVSRKPTLPKPYEHDNQFWLSLGTGAAVVSTYSGFAFNAGLYGSDDRFVYGLRYNATSDLAEAFNCAFQAFGDAFSFGSSSSGNCQVGNGTESALMLGGYLDHRHWSWAAIGISRVDGTGEHSPKDQRYIGAGLPIELVFSPPTGRYAAPEVRLNVDLNEKNSFAMLTLGLRLGQIK
jgi:hypothetical protein